MKVTLNSIPMSDPCALLVEIMQANRHALNAALLGASVKIVPEEKPGYTVENAEAYTLKVLQDFQDNRLGSEDMPSLSFLLTQTDHQFVGVPMIRETTFYIDAFGFLTHEDQQTRDRLIKAFGRTLENALSYQAPPLEHGDASYFWENALLKSMKYTDYSVANSIVATFTGKIEIKEQRCFAP